MFTLVNYSGAWNGGTFTFNYSNVLDGSEEFTAGLNTWSIDYDASVAGSNFAAESTYAGSVNLTVVPEPSSLSALVGGLGIRRVRRPFHR